jgi:hypothetical protein
MAIGGRKVPMYLPPAVNNNGTNIYAKSTSDTDNYWWNPENNNVTKLKKMV